MKPRKFKKSSRRRKRSVGATTHRRRRVGATALNFSATSPLVKWGSVLLGFMMPDLIPIKTWVGTKLDPKIVAGAEVGLGFLMAMKKNKGKPNMIMTIAGGYLLGAGLKNAAVSFGIMSGVGPYNLPVVGSRRIAGPYHRVPVIGAYTPNRGMNGYSTPSRMNGYSPNRVMSGVNNPQSGYTATDKGSGYMSS